MEAGAIEMLPSCCVQLGMMFSRQPTRVWGSVSINLRKISHLNRTDVTSAVVSMRKSLMRLFLSVTDAYVPESGDSLIGLLHKALTPDVAAMFIEGFRASAVENHSGMKKPLPAELFNVVSQKRSWVDRRSSPQALATFECPVLLSSRLVQLNKHYILADNWDPSPFRYFAAKVDGCSGWSLSKLPCGHNIMVDMPEELAEKLLRLV